MTFYRVFYVFSVAVVFFFIYLLPAFGVTTQIWEQQKQKDFESGKPENVSISSQGELMLAPQLDTFFEGTKEIYIWCLAEDSKGNIYAGTGNGGKIYRITPEGESSLFYDSPEVSILTLAIDANDTIYAGTAPDGLIYKLTDSSTPPTTVLSSEEKYVWALAFDDAGNLYAATGTGGKIYKVTPAGESSVVFDSDERNILCLLYHEGLLYAGSDGRGTIYSVKTADGLASVIYETGQKEVRRLVAGAGGLIYAATITTAAPEPSGPPPPPERPLPGGSRNSEEKKSKVYKVEPDGIVSVMWEVPDPLALSMVPDSEGGLYIGTGDSGKLYWVNADGDSVLKGKCSASQIFALHRSSSSGRFLLATGNAGKIFEMKADYLAEGTLESDAHDTKVVSRWGKLAWEGVTPEGTAISFATRSGNTKKPNGTWNAWSESLTVSEGSQITSPSARYIQWRAKLTTGDVSATPVLEKVTVASVQVNIEPRFTSVEVRRGDAPESSGPPEGIRRPRESRPPSNPNSGGEHTTKYTASWKVKDDNNDTLQFNVYYKGIDETNWKLLKKELKKSSYGWDSTSMSDGRYVIKVSATDKLSNPLNFAKMTEKVSDPFDIDNSQPTVTAITATANDDQTYQISCTVADASSLIKQAVYKIDSDEEWQVIFPDDGIFDSKQETLLLRTDSLPAGEHTITVRVTDAVGNSGVGRGTF